MCFFSEKNSDFWQKKNRLAPAGIVNFTKLRNFEGEVRAFFWEGVYALSSRGRKLQRSQPANVLGAAIFAVSARLAGYGI